MSDRTLKLLDTGDDVRIAQDLLNRAGAIIDDDGQFGGGTDRAVREFRHAHGMSDTGAIDDALWTLGDSGVTIVVGYDLGYQTDFETVWSDLPAQQIARLRLWVGKKGEDAKAGPSQLSDIAIPWQSAWKGYVRRTLPENVSLTRRTFVPAQRPLPKLCIGVLVSLVYNRGASMAGATRLEMRQIRDAVAADRYEEVPTALLAMRRLWPEGNGVRDRRAREAKLFEEGLSGNGLVAL